MQKRPWNNMCSVVCSVWYCSCRVVVLGSKYTKRHKECFILVGTFCVVPLKQAFFLVFFFSLLCFAGRQLSFRFYCISQDSLVLDTSSVC